MYSTTGSHSGVWKRPSPATEPLAYVRELNATAAALLRDGRGTEVPAISRSASGVIRRALDPQLLDEAMAHAEFGDQCMANGLADDAVAAYRDAVHHSRKKRGAADLRTLIASLGWVAVWIETGHAADAEPFLLEVISGLIKRCGGDHPITRMAQLCFASLRLPSA